MQLKHYSPDKVSLYIINGEPLFFQKGDEAVHPVLRLVHSYPHAFPRVQVDRGAIKFVLSGANVMCPGLTSKGANMEEDIDKDSVVSVYAEGKENALAVGYMKMSTTEIKELNKGIGLDNQHYLGDPLWHLKL